MRLCDDDCEVNEEEFRVNARLHWSGVTNFIQILPRQRCPVNGKCVCWSIRQYCLLHVCSAFHAQRVRAAH